MKRKSIKSYDAIIIGGGVAGLTAANFFRSQNIKVALLEQHTLLGGCAGYYQRRGPLVFDVGATTLSGLEKGRPFERVSSLLNLELELVSEDISQVLYLENFKVNRYKDHQKWIEELKIKWPNLPHEKFWNKLSRIEEKLWEISKYSKAYPPKSTDDVKDFYQILKAGNVETFSSFLQGLQSLMPREYLESPDLLKMIDQQLLISTQTTSDKVSAPLGAMGLCYPSDMAYPKGGMKSLITELCAGLNNIDVIKGAKVENMVKAQEWQVSYQTKRERIKICAPLVISTLPHWNMEKICEGEVEEYFLSLSHKFKPKWSALTAYFALKTKTIPETRYHQVHTASGSLFFSLSSGEQSRSPQGIIVGSVSTHIDLKDFSKEKHSSFKLSFEKTVRENLYKIIPEGEIEEVVMIEVGTPKTFEHFTGRHQGTVGGIPHEGLSSFLTFPKNETPFQGLYRVGDTVFPGQGVVGVMQGVLNCLERISL